MTGSLEQTSRLGTSFTYAQDLKTKRSFSATLTANGRKLHKHKMTLFNFAIAAVVAMVGFGNVQANDLQVTRGIGGAPVDEFSSAEIAASLAQSANLLVTDYILQQTEEQTSQSVVATIADNYLSKPIVIKTNDVSSKEIATFEVGHGDTLESIAKQFNVTTDSIRWANDISKNSTSLKLGQKIVIPPVSGVVYVVKAGDTADSIAKQFEANAAQIIAFNDAEIDGLVVGQKIVVPDGVQPAPIVTPYSGSKHYATSGTSFCGSENSSSLGRVKRGQVLGYMGSTGRSSGTHLHFGMCDSLGGSSIDPIASNDGDCPRRSYKLITAEGCSVRFGFSWPTVSKGHYISRGFYPGHRGFDLDNHPIGGSPPILAMADGEIIAQGWISGGGYSVVILHDNGIVSNYMHMSSLAL